MAGKILAAFVVALMLTTLLGKLGAVLAVVCGIALVLS